MTFAKFKIIIYLVYVYECLAWVYVDAWSPQRLGEGIRYPGTEVAEAVNDHVGARNRIQVL